MPAFLDFNAFEWGVLALALILIFGLLYVGPLSRALARTNHNDDSSDNTPEPSKS